MTNQRTKRMLTEEIPGPWACLTVVRNQSAEDDDDDDEFTSMLFSPSTMRTRTVQIEEKWPTFDQIENGMKEFFTVPGTFIIIHDPQMTQVYSIWTEVPGGVGKVVDIVFEDGSRADANTLLSDLEMLTRVLGDQ